MEDTTPDGSRLLPRQPSLDSLSSYEPAEEYSTSLSTNLDGPGTHAEHASALVAQFVQPSPGETSSQQEAHVFKRYATRQRVVSAVQDQDDVSAARQELAARRIQRAWHGFKHMKALSKRSICQYGDEAMELVQEFMRGKLPGEEKPPPLTQSAHLVLHFDVNKTILISDKVQGAESDYMVNMLLSECAWGRLEGSKRGPTWVPVGRLATDRPSNDPTLMTYRTFLDSFLLPFEEGDTPEVHAHNTRVKKQRQNKKRRFTGPGQPGEMFQGVFSSLVRALQVPQEQQAGPLADGEYRILPSFFRLLLHLDAAHRKFTIVFRTFGTDITDIIEEVNLFATGKHPAYPGVRMDGSNGRTNLVMGVPDTSGAFIRTAGNSDGTVLCLGANEGILGARSVKMADFEACQADDPDRVSLLNGFDAIYATLMTIAKKSGVNRAYTFRDYYPFWKHRNERSKAGKLLLMDPSDRDVMQIFFDDNIGYSTPHIVDARDVRTGDLLPFRSIQGLHLIKAEPLNAIMDAQYFVRAVHECEMAIRHRWHEEDSMQAALHSRKMLGKVLTGLDTMGGYNTCHAHHAAVEGLPLTPGVASEGMPVGALGAKLSANIPSIARVAVRAKRRWQQAGNQIITIIRLRHMLTDD